MGRLTNSTWQIGVVSLGFAALAAVYSAVTPKTYEAAASALLLRPEIDATSVNDEAAKNRWIWVRDGMAIKEEMTADEALLKLVASVPSLASQRANFSLDANSGRSQSEMDLLFVEHLRRRIIVVYTGADENIYQVRVREQDPKLARDIAEGLLGTLRAIVEASANSAAIARPVAATAAATIPLTVTKAHVGADSESRVHILRHAVEAEPIWPRPLLLVLLSALVGAVLGLGIDLLRTGALKRLLTA